MTHPVDSLLAEWAFYALVIFSLLVPALIYRNLWRRQAISRKAVLYFGVALIALAGLDVYLLPTLFAGTGLNIVSHVLITHLAVAERRFGGTRFPGNPAAESLPEFHAIPVHER